MPQTTLVVYWTLNLNGHFKPIKILQEKTTTILIFLNNKNDKMMAAKIFTKLGLNNIYETILTYVNNQTKFVQ